MRSHASALMVAVSHVMEIHRTCFKTQLPRFYRKLAIFCPSSLVFSLLGTSLVTRICRCMAAHCLPVTPTAFTTGDLRQLYGSHQNSAYGLLSQLGEKLGSPLRHPPPSSEAFSTHGGPTTQLLGAFVPATKALSKKQRAGRGILPLEIRPKHGITPLSPQQLPEHRRNQTCRRLHKRDVAEIGSSRQCVGLNVGNRRRRSYSPRRRESAWHSGPGHKPGG